MPYSFFQLIKGATPDKSLDPTYFAIRNLLEDISEPYSWSDEELVLLFNNFQRNHEQRVPYFANLGIAVSENEYMNAAVYYVVAHAMLARAEDLTYQKKGERYLILAQQELIARGVV